MIIKVPKINPLLVLVYFALILYAANLKEVLNIERFNPIEKSTWLIVAVYLFLGRKVSAIWAIGTALAVLWACFFAFLNDSGIFSSSVFIFSLSQIPILFFLCGSKLHDKEIKGFFFAYSIMPIAICILGVVYQTLGMKEMFQAEFYTGLYRFGGSMIPAYLAGWCVAAIYSSLVLYDKYRERAFLFFLCLNFFILFLTVARVPLLIAVVLTLFYFVFKFSWMKNKLRIFTYYSMPALLFVFYFLYKNADRLFSGGTSGRDMIWDHLLYEYEFYFKPFGAGFGHQYLLMDDEVVNLTGTVGAHNDYIRLLVELGFVGSIGFWIIFVGLVLISIISKVSNNFVDKCEITISLSLLMMFAYFDNVLAAPAVFSFFVLAMIKFNSR